jgi:hypothetical protein
MAKKQLTPFSKLLISGVAGVLLVGGAMASIFAAQQNQDVSSRAYDPSSRLGVVRPYPTPVAGPQCYDRVILSAGGYYWPDACRGRVTSGMCAQVLVKLTDDEVLTYKKWVSLGKPAIPGCSTAAMTPAPVPSWAPQTPKPTYSPKPTAWPVATPQASDRPVRMPVQTVYPGYVQY